MKSIYPTCRLSQECCRRDGLKVLVERMTTLRCIIWSLKVLPTLRLGQKQSIRPGVQRSDLILKIIFGCWQNDMNALYKTSDL